MNEQDVQVVVFTLDGEEYALGVSEVTKVVELPELTPIPNSPDYVLGFINISGQIIPIISLEKKFALERQNTQVSPDKVVVIERDQSSFGLLVDSVSEVIRIPQAQIQAPPEIISQKIGNQHVMGAVVLSEANEDADEQASPNGEERKQEDQRTLLLLNSATLLDPEAKEQIDNHVPVSQTEQDGSGETQQAAPQVTPTSPPAQPQPVVTPAPTQAATQAVPTAPTTPEQQPQKGTNG